MADTSFLQDPPRLGNQWTEDSFLRAIVRRLVAPPVLSRFEPELERLGHRVSKELHDVAKALDQPENYPRLVHVDPWGRRVDDILTHEGWRRMKAVSAEEGLIADGYDKSVPGPDRRVVQFAKLYLYSPSSGLYTCPLAMTDGCARVLEQALSTAKRSKAEAEMFGDGNIADRVPAASVQLMRDAEAALKTKNPAKFFTSGQWMTERKGGSDVANGTETIARKQPNGTYKLFGYKWFTSATDSDVALTLARIVDEATGKVEEGTGGLSCFLLRVRKDDGSLNAIRVVRLKNKLGTKQLPTAELELIGTEAHLVSLPRRGIPTIASGMVNITRLHNCVGSASGIRRLLAIARDYAHRREVFGSKLADNPLHLRTLAGLEVQQRVNLSLTLEAAALLGKVEDGVATEEEDMLLRLLTPVAKAYTAKTCVAGVSELLESFGGQGYQEDTGLPRGLRDAQVLPIWEGTTNVLSMDVLRVLAKTRGKAIGALAAAVSRRCSPVDAVPAPLREAARATMAALNELVAYVRVAMSGGLAQNVIESHARELLFSVARIYASSSLVEHAAWSRVAKDAAIARRFAAESGDGPLFAPSLSRLASAAADARDALLQEDRDIALDVDEVSGQPRWFGNVDQSGAPRARI